MASDPDLLSDDLIRRVKSGDQKAQARFARQLLQESVGYVRMQRARGNYLPLEEDDAAQEICVKAWRNLDSYTTDAVSPKYKEDNFRGWLKVLADRLMISLVKKANRRNHHTVPFDAPADNDDELGYAHEHTAQSEDGRESIGSQLFGVEVKTWLDEYPNARHAEVVRLHYFEGLSYQQISERVDGLGTGGVGAVLNRMRNEMKEVWGV